MAGCVKLKTLEERLEIDALYKELLSQGLNPAQAMNEAYKAFWLKQEAIFEMANLHKRITGLSADLWIDEDGDSRSVPHNVKRIKFQTGKGMPRIPISVSDNPEALVNAKTNLSSQELNQIKDFISLLENISLKLKEL